MKKFRFRKITNPNSVGYGVLSRRVYRGFYEAVRRHVFNSELPEKLPIKRYNENPGGFFAQLDYQQDGTLVSITVADAIASRQSDRWLDQLFRHEELHGWLVLNGQNPDHEGQPWAWGTKRYDIRPEILIRDCIYPLQYVCTVCDFQGGHILDKKFGCPNCGSALILVGENYPVSYP